MADAVSTSPADLTWDVPPREADDLVQPDVFVVHPEEVSGEWLDITGLLLAVEVVSPASARGDRVVKRRMYQRRAVAAYWVVDPDAGLVEVWQLGDERPVIVTDVLMWRWQADAPELRLPLAELFSPPRVRAG